MIREEIAEILSQYDLKKFKIPTAEDIAKGLMEKEAFQNTAKIKLGRFSLIYISTTSILFGSRYLLTKYVKTSQSKALANILNKFGYITLICGSIVFSYLYCAAYDIRF